MRLRGFKKHYFTIARKMEPDYKIFYEPDGSGDYARIERKWDWDEPGTKIMFIRGEGSVSIAAGMGDASTSAGDDEIVIHTHKKYPESYTYVGDGENFGFYNPPLTLRERGSAFQNVFPDQEDQGYGNFPDVVVWNSRPYTVYGNKIHSHQKPNNFRVVYAIYDVSYSAARRYAGITDDGSWKELNWYEIDDFKCAIDGAESIIELMLAKVEVN